MRTTGPDGDVAAVFSAAPSGGARWTSAPEREEKEKEEFLLLTRVLLKHMEHCSDARMLASARGQIEECHMRNITSNPQFASLVPVLKARLRATVGEIYWKMAHDHVNHLLRGGEGTSEKKVHLVSPVRVHVHSRQNEDPLWLRQRQRLLLLSHAARCPHRDRRCPVNPHCAAMKHLLNHLPKCRDPRCPMPHCVSCRDALGHYLWCADVRRACRPVWAALRVGADVSAAAGRYRVPQPPGSIGVTSEPSSTTAPAPRPLFGHHAETRSPPAEPSGVRAFLKRKKQWKRQERGLFVQDASGENEARPPFPRDAVACPQQNHQRPVTHRYAGRKRSRKHITEREGQRCRAPHGVGLRNILRHY